MCLCFGVFLELQSHPAPRLTRSSERSFTRRDVRLLRHRVRHNHIGREVGSRTVPAGTVGEPVQLHAAGTSTQGRQG